MSSAKHSPTAIRVSDHEGCDPIHYTCVCGRVDALSCRNCDEALLIQCVEQPCSHFWEMLATALSTHFWFAP